MPNYTQLNAGLERASNFGARVMQFAQNERRLDLSQQHQDLLAEKFAEDQRIRRGEEYARYFMGAAQEAAANNAPLPKYLGENAHARDGLLNSLAKSNSHFRNLSKGRQLRSVRGENGRYYVQALEEGQWTTAKDEAGADFTFSEDEMSYAARLEAASYGRAELIRIDRQTQALVAEGKITEEEAEQTRKQLSAANTQLMTESRKAGIPPEEIVEMQLQGENAEAQEAEAATGPVLDDAGNPMEVGSLAWRGGIVKRPYRATDKDIENQRAKNTESESDDSTYNTYLNQYQLGGVEIQPEDSTAERVGKNISNELRGQYNSLAAPVLATAASGIDEGLGVLGNAFRGAGEAVNGVLGIDSPNESAQQTATADSPAPTARPQIPEVLQQPAAEGDYRPAQVTAKTKQSGRALRAELASPAPDGKAAAAYYANGMLINGLAPNSQILANLEAGDNMRGDMRFMMDQELKWLEHYRKSSKQQQDTLKAKRTRNSELLDNLGGAIANASNEINPADGKWVANHTAAMVAPLVNNVYGTRGGPMDWDEPTLLAVGESIRKAMELHGKEAGGFMGFFSSRIDARGKAHKSIVPPEIRGMIELDALRESNPDEYSRMLSMHGGQKGASLVLGRKAYQSAEDIE